MYIWKVNNLVADFRQDNVSEREKYKYFLLSAIIITLIIDPLLKIGHIYSIIDAINLIAQLIITYAGISYCYRCNISAGNKDFIVRAACLGVPVGIRTFVFAIPVFIIVGIIDMVMGVGLETTSILMLIASVIFSVAFYIFLGQTIKSIGIEPAKAEPIRTDRPYRSQPTNSVSRAADNRQPVTVHSVQERLNELAHLKNTEVISEVEYQAKRKSLIEQL